MDPYETESIAIWERPFNLMETIVDEIYQIFDLHGLIPHPVFFYSRQLKLLNMFESRFNLHNDDYLVILDYVHQLVDIPVGYYLTTRNSSYILLVLIILYIKMYDDTYCLNSFFAKCFKIDLKLLSKTEYALFQHLDLYEKFSGGIL
jgi:hypothetical protein